MDNNLHTCDNKYIQCDSRP